MDDRISSDESVLLSKSGEESSTNVENTAEGSRVPTRTKFFFGVGAGGEAASMWIFNALGLLFYQQILGLPAGLAGRWR